MKIFATKANFIRREFCTIPLNFVLYLLISYRFCLSVCPCFCVSVCSLSLSLPLSLSPSLPLSPSPSLPPSHRRIRLSILWSGYGKFPGAVGRLSYIVLERSRYYAFWRHPWKRTIMLEPFCLTAGIMLVIMPGERDDPSPPSSPA